MKMFLYNLLQFIWMITPPAYIQAWKSSVRKLCKIKKKRHDVVSSENPAKVWRDASLQKDYKMIFLFFPKVLIFGIFANA